jgi:hypothetical protein
MHKTVFIRHKNQEKSAPLRSAKCKMIRNARRKIENSSARNSLLLDLVLNHQENSSDKFPSMR